MNTEAAFTFDVEPAWDELIGAGHDPRAYMWMGVETATGKHAFKHRDSRAYVYIAVPRRSRA